MAHHTLARPIRVGIFSAIDKAEQAVRRLLQVGFRKDEITVICSNRDIERHFHEFEHQEPAGFYTTWAVALGAALGAGVGLLAAVGAIIAAGEEGNIGMAGIFVASGAVLGGLIGAMMTRGAERELANFYNQSAPDGSIMVAAETHSERPEPLLTQAEQVLAEAGAEPLELAEG